MSNCSRTKATRFTVRTKLFQKDFLQLVQFDQIRRCWNKNRLGRIGIRIGAVFCLAVSDSVGGFSSLSPWPEMLGLFLTLFEDLLVSLEFCLLNDSVLFQLSYFLVLPYHKQASMMVLLRESPKTVYL